MLLRWLFAAAHLLGLGVGLGAVWARARALRGVLDRTGLARVFYADNCWALAAVLWIGTGLVRAFGGLEKGSTYYLQNHFFRAKMVLLGLILLLELVPMIGLIRWRREVAQGRTPDTSPAARFARISYLQAALVILMVLVATGMARGLGTPG